MSDLLKQFHDQELMREEVFNYITKTIDSISIEMVRSNKDTTNLSVAYTAVERVQAALKKDYGLKIKKDIKARQL